MVSLTCSNIEEFDIFLLLAPTPNNFESDTRALMRATASDDEVFYVCYIEAMTAKKIALTCICSHSADFFFNILALYLYTWSSTTDTPLKNLSRLTRSNMQMEIFMTLESLEIRL